MKKYIIWDFNGTILDDLDLCINLLNDMLNKQNKKSISKETYLDIFGFPIYDYYLKAGLSFEQQSFDSMSVDFIKQYQPLSFKQNLHEGVVETLERLNQMGIVNIILSASETKNLFEQTDYFDITKYFKHIVGTDNVKGLGKIDAGIRLIEALNIDKKTVLYIGDTIHDLEVAEALDVNLVFYGKGHQSLDRLKLKDKPIITHIGDIIKYIA